jgi:hypothetical protein
MDNVFPIGLPAATAFYVTLYVLTFALHQALMHYVLAGSLFVTLHTMLGRGETGTPARRLPADLLRDWMPFMLSAAITAGVAPLLFVQILCQHEFYTANLLLAWRWMVVIPVLIVAFYLLYLLKSQRLLHWARPARVAVAALASVGFVFVGFCWTANYLLSVSESSWADVYVSGSLPFDAVDVGSRMLVWLGGAFASMAMFVGWQLAGFESASPDRIDVEDAAAGPRSLAIAALGGLAAAVVGGAIFLWRADEELRAILFGVAGGPYLAVAVAGVIAQAWGWIAGRRRGAITRLRLAVVTVGWIVALVSVSVMRELARLASLSLERLGADHAMAAEFGGFTVFLLFAVLNFGAIAAVVWIVRRSL